MYFKIKESGELALIMESVLHREGQACSCRPHSGVCICKQSDKECGRFAGRKGEFKKLPVKSFKGGWEAFLETWSGSVGVGGIIKPKSLAFSVHSIRKRATGRKQTKPSNKRWMRRWIERGSHLRFIVIYSAVRLPAERLSGSHMQRRSRTDSYQGDAKWRGNPLYSLQRCFNTDLIIVWHFNLQLHCKNKLVIYIFIYYITDKGKACQQQHMVRN